jgi:glutamate/aspartate transport system substrate-binding protein
VILPQAVRIILPPLTSEFMNIISANGHPEAFQMVETGRAAAFVMDDILLYSLQASSRNPKDFEISDVSLSLQPYGPMMRKGDDEFKKAVDEAIGEIFKSGEIDKLYHKWFEEPVPPKGINLNVPMSAELKKIIAHPTDSGDPKAYE